jgi:hypothetical protein
MAKTKTTQKSSLTSWNDVDQQLRVIAIENAAIKKAEGKMNEEVLAIQKGFEEGTREARPDRCRREADRALLHRAAR